MAKDIRFKVSSALKNLIGQELITDEFIAIFELVKNSFDAHATKVTITFDPLSNKEGSRIIIADNGKGMNYEDLINKWLFVAYSAKKEGTEDSGEYRDKINQRKFFAGAKGVGRFSCDRLGSKLNLITVQKKTGAKMENLIVNWEDFEKDAEQQFAEVDIKHQTLKKSPFNIKHGTILEITGLRDEWNRKSLLKLKQSLGKLINPEQGNDASRFSIEIAVPEEKGHDKTFQERERVNGLVQNFLFEKLGLKTTQIASEISPDGKLITTVLRDRGRLIYKITEHSKFEDTLHDIKIHLFQLNRSAKVNFSAMMGMQPIKYGSVFLYKNGFRVYPFGEEGEDDFGVNRRKAQGHNRFLGTRDLIGRIEINGKNEDLKETTSRDGGLINNKSFKNLEEFFYDYALKRLEKYVVDVIKWGDDQKIPGLDRLSPALNPEDVKPEIAEVIASLSNSTGIVNFEYDKDFLNFIADSQEKSLPKMVKNFQRIAEESGNKALGKEAQKMASRVQELISAKTEAEKAQDAAQEKIRITQDKLEEEVSEKLFAKSVLTTDLKDVIALQHQIDHSTDRIKRNVDSLLVAVNKKAAKKEVLGYIERISLEANKISSIAQFVTKANFNLKASEITADIVSFIKEYIENVYREYPTTRINRPHVNFRVVTNGTKFSCKFRPLEMIIVMDSLLNNSFKAGARNIQVTFTTTAEKDLQITVKDDGHGIDKKIVSKVFNLGFTTTKGSGIGLYHVKQIVEKMGGDVDIGKTDKGAAIIIHIKK